MLHIPLKLKIFDTIHYVLPNIKVILVYLNIILLCQVVILIYPLVDVYLSCSRFTFWALSRFIFNLIFKKNIIIL